MRQMSDSDYAAVLRHLPRVAAAGLRSRDGKMQNSARMLTVVLRRMERAESRRVSTKTDGYGKD